MKLLTACIFTFCSFVSAQQFTTFDAPGAVNTHPTAIGKNGVIIGTWDDGMGNRSNFVRKPAGTFVTMKLGHAIITPLAINDSGVIVGNLYRNSHFGFWKKTNVVQVKEAQNTTTTAINAAGTFTGQGSDSITHTSFIYTDGPFGRVILNLPNAVSTAIDSAGNVAGQVSDGTHIHGFLWNQQGVTQIDVPEATDTFVYGMNDSGMLAGTFMDNAGNQHGFVQVAGAITTFDPVGSVGTQVTGLNKSGLTVGYYWDQNMLAHGFTRTMQGVISTVDVPDANETFIYGVNRNGKTTGEYADSSWIFHGFIY